MHLFRKTTLRNHEVRNLFGQVQLIINCLLILNLMLSTQVATAAKGFAIFDPAVIVPSPAAPRPFDVIGFLEDAQLDENNTAGTCAQRATDPRLAGGSAKINGISIIIPCNTAVQMPATSLTWADLFYLNPAAVKGVAPQSGLSLSDSQTLPSFAQPPLNAILPSYEVQIQGNIVQGRYIAGLVFVSQQLANSGQGIIETINYTLGELNIKNSKTGELVRVRINDPIGKFGKPHAAPGSLLPDAVIETNYDPRLTADLDNPTIRAVTGFPMCIPRTSPFIVGQGDDILCPESNRPRSPNCKSLPATYSGRAGFPPFALPPTGAYCSQFMMEPPLTGASTCSGATCPTDPTRQAPFEIGDYITYSGTLKTEVDTSTGVKYTYISAHTIIANLGIYTASGIPPAYVALESSRVGTSALPISNLPQEATSAIRVEGFTTDPTTLVDIFMVDVNYLTGKVTDRRIGTENPGLPPVIGRFRFQPIAGSYGPFTRDLRVVSQTACRSASPTCAGALLLVANGIQAGQFRAPNFEFIFPEAVRTGDPMVPLNFQDLYFLYCGSGPMPLPAFNSSTTTTPVLGPLDPSPWAAPMPSPIFSAACPAPNGVALPPPSPIVNAGANQSVVSGAAVTLTGTATDPSGAALTSFNWQQLSGPIVTFTTGGTAAAPTLKFTAPAASGPLVFALNVTNAKGQTGTAKVMVAVNPDTISIVSAVFDNRQLKGVLTVVATSSLPATTAGLKLSIQASNGTYVMATAPQVMSTVANTSTATICPAASNPCWQYTASGVIKNTLSTSFMPPSSITVTSSMGGQSTIGSTSIVLK